MMQRKAPLHPADHGSSGGGDTTDRFPKGDEQERTVANWFLDQEDGRSRICHHPKTTSCWVVIDNF